MAPQTILIRDKVKCITPDHYHEGKIGTVRASKETGLGIEHHVEFDRRVFTAEEIDRGDDLREQGENVAWLLSNEIEKV